MTDSLIALFKSIRLEDEGVYFLIVLWHAIQFLDDVADHETMDADAIHNGIYTVLIDLPACDFYRRHFNELSVCMSNAVMKWTAANHAERDKVNLDMAYSWRASYYDVVMQVAKITHGPQLAMKISKDIIGMYGENRDEYMKEMENA
jgi:hypothetical protein